MGRKGPGRRQIVAAVLGAIVALAAAPGPAAQGRDVDRLMLRVGDYIEAFVGRFSNVVAEETYDQRTSAPSRKRLLKSDFLLVRYPGATVWLSFRDTFEVDGQVVRKDPDRLARLFLEPPDNAVRRAQEILGASAKYNLVNIGTVNFPLLAMSLVQRGYLARHRFTMGNIDKSLGPDVRIVQFQEYVRPTILRDSGRDLFTRGLIWVEQQSGRILRTELRIGISPSGMQRRQGGDVNESITIFKPDEELGLTVPVEMQDWYPARGSAFYGVATYGRFRKFQVTTEETIR